MSFSPLAAVILGAGASSRMGSPKLLLPWGGTTVVGHLVAQWRAAGVGRVAVVLRPGDVALEKELDRIGLPPGDRIVNPRHGEGMFSSVVAAARWEGWGAETEAWAFALGDQPHLRTETLAGLLAFHAAHPGRVCQPVFLMTEGRPRHPVILPRSVGMRLGTTAAATLRDFLEEEERSGSLVRQGWPSDDGGLSLDLDTPEDYRKALAAASVPFTPPT